MSLGNLGQIEPYIQSVVERWLEQYGPALGTKLVEVAQPAAVRAAESITPILERKLSEYVPKFAVISGGIVGLAFIAGVLLARGSGTRT